MRSLLMLSLLCVSVAADPLDDALRRAGFQRKELGWKPRGWWQRFPRGVTHKLDHFDDLFAEPLATVPFTRVLGRATRDLLGAEGLAKKPERGAHSLYRLVHTIGINRRFGGIRPYSPNLTAKPTPLDEAILQLYRYARRKTKFVTFGNESPYPQIEKDLKAAAAKLPPEVSKVLGQLVLNIVDAHYWAELAFRKVDMKDQLVVSKRLDLGMESVDALEYIPECDDVAKAWDESSLWYAAGKCVEALDTARRQLQGAKVGAGVNFDWETPLGWIRVRGSGNDTLDAKNTLLLVDLGGTDEWTGAVGAATATQRIGLCLDMGGDDIYLANRKSHGSGMCGVGILMDAAGKDTYRATQQAQGVGQFGFGALIDLAGDDKYTARYSAQGCGYFGVGLLIDAAGKDTYYLHADGQGFGGVGGVGVLADRSGDDKYTAEPDGPKSGRPSYHSQGKIAVSNAQGCAMGRRGDGADGHNWAGGLGALLDAEGNDTYVSGNWSMGTGYWFGMGALWDGGGDDTYTGHVWSQATGAHFCIGVLLDEGGNDKHISKARSCLSFGHDFAITILLNSGGDDVYECPGDGCGFSINRSVSLLIDTAGTDRYASKHLGFARYDKRFADDEAHSTYWADALSIGLFLDIGGTDTYGDKDRNNTEWVDEPDSDNWKVRNVGVGVDIEKGVIDWHALRTQGRR